MKKLRICVDVLLFIALLGVILTPYFIRINPAVAFTSPGSALARNLHFIFGFAIAGLMVAHMVICWKWVTGILKNYKKAPILTKLQLWMMLLLFLSMAISICSGIMWGFFATPQLMALLQPLHQISSIMAIVIVGLHMGLHMSRFLGLVKKAPAKKG